MSLKKIAILGTGASSFSSALSFFDSKIHNFQIDVIDFGDNPNDNKDLNSTPVETLKSNHKNASVLKVDPLLGLKSEVKNLPVGTSSFGGWAEMWGATISPFKEEDIRNWPIDIDSLLPHQARIKSELTFAKTSDWAMEEKNAKSRIKSGLQDFVNSIEISKNPSNFEYTNSVLAINDFAESPEKGCIQCERCLSGCEYDQIWIPSIGWKKIFTDSRFTYKKNYWIETIIESFDGVKLCAKTKKGDSVEIGSYEYVFVGLGSIQTGALLLRSKLTKNVVLKENRIYTIPFVISRFKRTGSAQKRVSLSDVFMRIKSLSTVIDLDFFAQLYGHNSQIQERIVQSSKVLQKFPRILVGVVLKRMGIAMFFLDEKISNEISLTLNEGRVETKEIIYTDFPIKKIRMMIKAALKTAKLFPFFFLAHLGKTGESYHLGSSFPMTSNPISSNHSDMYGRPNGMKRVSVVDSSIFTTLPATPLTFNMMANAHRISTYIIENVLNESPYK